MEFATFSQKQTLLDRPHPHHPQDQIQRPDPSFDPSVSSSSTALDGKEEKLIWSRSQPNPSRCFYTCVHNCYSFPQAEPALVWHHPCPPLLGWSPGKSLSRRRAIQCRQRTAEHLSPSEPGPLQCFPAYKEGPLLTLY